MLHNITYQIGYSLWFKAQKPTFFTYFREVFKAFAKVKIRVFRTPNHPQKL